MFSPDDRSRPLPGRHVSGKSRTMIRTQPDHSRAPACSSSDQPHASDLSGILPAPANALRRWIAQVRAGLRLGALVVWVPLSVGFEACLLPVPGTAKIRWTRVIWGVLCKILGLRIRVIGQRAGTVGGPAARKRGERPVIYIANHMSWLDVPFLARCCPPYSWPRAISKNGRSWGLSPRSGARFSSVASATPRGVSAMR